MRIQEFPGSAQAGSRTGKASSLELRSGEKKAKQLQGYYLTTYTTGTTKEPKPHSLPFGREPQALTPARNSRPMLLLLDFGFRASFFQLLLAGFCVCFRNRFFHGLRCAIDQIFGFFQAQTGDFANCLDDANFVRAEIGQNQVEFGLLFSSRASSGAASCWSCHCCGRNAELLFECLDQVVQVHY